jgi:hypothetical protein
MGSGQFRCGSPNQQSLAAAIQNPVCVALIVQEIAHIELQSKEINDAPEMQFRNREIIPCCIFLRSLRIFPYARLPLLSPLYARSIARAGDLGLT